MYLYELILEANTQSDATLTKVNRSTYAGYANKEGKGTPSQFLGSTND